MKRVGENIMINNQQRPIDVKVGIKPVCANWHISPWEGIVMKEISTEEAQKRFDKSVEDLKNNLPEEATVLKPVFIERGECISKKEDEELKNDLQNVDLFLPYSFGAWGGGYTAVQLGQKYKKPVVSSPEIVANLRSRNLEGYVALDRNELNYLISLLQVRKAVNQTKMLIVSEGLLPRDVSDNIWDLEGIRTRFGADYQSISLVEFFNEMDRVIQDTDEQKRAEDIADKLIKNAQKVHIDRRYVIKSISFYIAAKNLMGIYGCNAFTIPCCDTIPNTMATKRKIVPCLTHTLLKDEGIPSACQYDITSLLTMMFLMYISKKSACMGNSSYDLNKNTIRLWHDVPGLKMHSLNKPDLPYELRNFTPSGWGTNVRYDFARDKGEKVTLARFNPLATKILVAKGEIVGCENFNKIGCSLAADIEVPDVRELIHKLADFGVHLVMVYGDYTQKLKELGKLMKFEVTEV